MNFEVTQNNVFLNVHALTRINKKLFIADDIVNMP